VRALPMDSGMDMNTNTDSRIKMKTIMGMRIE
jgi:hypothetical protein